MKSVKIALIGAGSQSFGPGTVRDVLLSEPLAEIGVELVLMDIVDEHLADSENYARYAAEKLDRKVEISATTSLETAVEGADYVVTAIEVDRYLYWSQDFHLPRKYGFRQVYGENGGPGGLFHALRNMGPSLEIARTMERLCPRAILLNYTNPEHKLCEAITRLTGVQAVGLCHGVFMGQRQISHILEMPLEELELTACGINHFTWFQTIRHRKSGEDLYPRLRQMEREGDELADWHEIGLSRVLLRRFGLWPAPATNHHGEYIRWADEFMASQMHFYYDPAEGEPWKTNRIPEFVYTIDGVDTGRAWRPEEKESPPLEEQPMRASGELAVPLMEGISCGLRRELDAINVPNQGAMPDMPDDMVVEIPGAADENGLHRCQMEPLPEGIAAMLRLQGSIHKLLVEAFAEGSKEKLLQTILLEPTVDSYQRAVAFMEEMLALQTDILPKFS